MSCSRGALYIENKVKATLSCELGWTGHLTKVGYSQSFLQILELRSLRGSACLFSLFFLMEDMWGGTEPFLFFFFFFFTLLIGLQRKLVERKNEADSQRETMVRAGERTSWVLNSTSVLGSRPSLRSSCILALGFYEKTLYNFTFLLLKSSKTLLHENYIPRALTSNKRVLPQNSNLVGFFFFFWENQCTDCYRSTYILLFGTGSSWQ